MVISGLIGFIDPEYITSATEAVQGNATLYNPREIVADPIDAVSARATGPAGSREKDLPEPRVLSVSQPVVKSGSVLKSEGAG